MMRSASLSVLHHNFYDTISHNSQHNKVSLGSTLDILWSTLPTSTPANKSITDKSAEVAVVKQDHVMTTRLGMLYCTRNLDCITWYVSLTHQGVDADDGGGHGQAAEVAVVKQGHVMTSQPGPMVSVTALPVVVDDDHTRVRGLRN